MNPPVHGYLGLGSNLGDRLASLQRAVGMLSASAGLTVMRVSQIYECPPWGYDSPNHYLNAVAEITWDGPPLKLWELCYRIEAAVGRHAEGPEQNHEYEDRIVDLDVLWLDGVESSDERLSLPHPRAHQRAFVLVPWHELAPELTIRGRSLTGWIASLPAGEVAGVKALPDAALLIPD